MKKNFFKQKLTLIMMSSILVSCFIGYYTINNPAPISIKNYLIQTKESKQFAKSKVTHLSNAPEVTSSFSDQNNSSLKNLEPAWQMGNMADESIEIPELAVANTTQIIQANENFMEQEQLSVQLPNGQNLNIQKSNTVEYASGSKSWAGFDPQQPELFVAITKKDNAIAGSIQTLDGSYEIASLKNGTQIIYQLDNKKVDQFKEGLKYPEADTVGEFDSLEKSASSVQPTTVSASGDAPISEITIMFVYTRAAVNANGLNNLIAATESEVTVSNLDTFPNSKVNIRLKPVHHVIYEYPEKSSMIATLNDIQNSNNLNVEALRDKYSADLVQSVVTNNDYGGYAWVMNSASSGDSFKRSAYSAVQVARISTTMAHEIGHNLGLNHNKENAQNLSGFSDAFGYRYCQSGGYRTIMSYACSGAGRIKRFSNPNVLYNGLPTGVVSSANNARVLEEVTRFRAASFRTGPIPTPTPKPTPAPQPTATPKPPITDLIDGKLYKIFARHSNKALSVSNASLINSAKIIQYDYKGLNHQKWVASDKGNGNWTLIALHSRKCSDVLNNSLSNGGNIIQNDCNNRSNQEFKIKNLGNGFVYIQGRNSNKCLDVAGSSQENNATVYQWSCIGQTNAQWKLYRLN